MKKIAISIIIFVFVLSTPSLVVAQEIEHTGTVNEVLGEILSSQNVSEITDINCSEISDDQFEELGDAYMEQIHPGQAHEYMDQMMGGEGSLSLKLAHIRMGSAYLGCGYSVDSGYGIMGGMGMMGGYGTMGRGLFNQTGSSGWNMMDGGYSYGMMQGFNFAHWPAWITLILVWLLLIFAIVAIGKWLSRQK